MKEYARNLSVGITVLVAMVMLGVMIVIFTGLPQMFERGYKIRITAPTTYDAHEGDPVHLSGMKVGRITDVEFTDPDHPTAGVTFTARIANNVPLPGNTKAFFFTKGLTGNAYIELYSHGEYFTDAQGIPVKFLPTDGSAKIGSVHKGSGLLPEKLEDALAEFGKLAENLNKMLAPPPGQTGTAPATADAQKPNVGGVLFKINRTLDAMYVVLGDAENQANIKTSFANLAKATNSAEEAMKLLREFATEARKTAVEARNVTTQASKTFKDVSAAAETTRTRMDQLARKLIENSDKISALLTTIQASAVKLEKGQGTAGKLLNDPKLYNNLTEATQQMSALLKDFRALVREWKKQGMKVKLK